MTTEVKVPDSTELSSVAVLKLGELFVYRRFEMGALMTNRQSLTNASLQIGISLRTKSATEILAAADSRLLPSLLLPSLQLPPEIC